MYDSILSGSNFKSPQNDTSNQPKKEEQQRKQESRQQNASKSVELIDQKNVQLFNI